MIPTDINMIVVLFVGGREIYTPVGFIPLIYRDIQRVCLMTQIVQPRTPIRIVPNRSCVTDHSPNPCCD